jgi:copper transport protein
MMGLAGLLFVVLMTVFPSSVMAHAILVSAVPEQDSRLQDSPPQISLTFNERLEEGLYYIKVYDNKGKSVTSNAAKMNGEHTGMTLDLPKLAQGTYLVSYRVISADGHPVGGSYLFTVDAAASDQGQPRPAPSVPGGQHQHGISGSMSVGEVGRYLVRGLYYLSLLSVTGWALWLKTAQGTGEWTRNLLRVHFIVLLLFIFTHMEDLIGNGGLAEIGQLFAATGIGLNWLISVLLAAAGFLLVGRSLWLNLVWALAMLAVKSLNGHSAAASAQPWPVIVDAIHLLAAALWIGGLWVIVAKRRSDQDSLPAFMRRFSNVALASILALVLTGASTVLLLLPGPRYLLYTTWGILLLVKIGLVVLVIVTAGFLRLQLRKRTESRIKPFLAADISLMLAILLLVGLLTYMPPLPANEPVYWHEMGETVHMTASISPGAPGTNTFILKVWLPEQAGKPKLAQMRLFNEDNAQIAPITVPLQPYEDKSFDESYGRGEILYSYKAQGNYLPFAGSWRLEIRITDADDNEKVYEKQFRIY